MNRQILRSFSRRPIIVWDTETTGLGPKKNRIVEIALKELECTSDKSMVLSFSSLIHPSGLSKPRAPSRINGITNKMMQDAPDFKDVWEGVKEYVHHVCAKGGSFPILIAHNISFDLGFLKEELKRINEPLPAWDFACSLRDVANILWPGEKASLAALTKRFDIVNEEAHRALCDVNATAAFLSMADNDLRTRAQQKRISILPKGEYIRKLIEISALKRRHEIPEIRSRNSNFCVQNQFEKNFFHYPYASEELFSLLGTNIDFQGSRKEESNKKMQKDALGVKHNFRKMKRERNCKWGNCDKDNFYITPTGNLWHLSRACLYLSTANIIMRVSIRPQKKKPCPKCLTMKRSESSNEKTFAN